MMSRVSSIIVGRETELRILRGAITAARDGRGGMVVLEGEAGIGKTALATCACEDANAQGCLVLTGNCYDLTVTPAFGPWKELIASNPVMHHARGALESLAAGNDQETHLLTTLFSHLENTAADHPMVLLLENIQWADAASLDLLRVLARRLATLPILTIVTCRTDTPGSGYFAILLDLIEREAAPIVLSLRPVAMSALGNLLEHRYPMPETDIENLAGYVHRRSDGNMFFATQIIRALEEEDILHLASNVWSIRPLDDVPLPPRLRKLLEARLQRLPGTTRTILTLGAVIGETIPATLWHTVSGLTEEAILDAIEPAVQAHLIEPDSRNDAFRFTHALMRETIYEAILPLRRRILHRRVAAVLLQHANPNPGEIAHHLAFAEDPRAVDWLIEAGHHDEAAGAALTASSRYIAAANLLEQSGGDPVRRGWLHLDIGFLCRFQNRESSREHLRQAELLAATSDDPYLAALTQLVLGRSQFLDGAPVRSVHHTDAGNAALTHLPRLPVDDPRHLREISIRSTWNSGFAEFVLAHSGQLQQARAAIPPEFDIRTGSAIDLPPAFTQFGLACIHAFSGRASEAQSAYDLALAAYAAVPYAYDMRVAATLVARDALATVTLPYFADQPDVVRRSAANVAATANRLVSANTSAPSSETARQALLALLALQGKWDDVTRIAALPDEHQLLGCMQYASGILGYIAAARGQTELALEYVRECWPQGPASPSGSRLMVHTLGLQLLAANIALRAGNLELARLWLDGHLRWLDAMPAVRGRAEQAIMRSCLALAEKDFVASRNHAEKAQKFATSPHQPLALLQAHLLHGDLGLAQPENGDASTSFQLALDLAIQCDAPYEAALARIGLVRSLIHTGERGQIQEHLDIAREVFTALGAAPAIRECDVLMAQFPSLHPDHPAGLTDREIELLRLLAEGLTNPQIASRLFISPKTVSAHLVNIYTKLGVTSRTAATRAAIEHHLI